MSAFDGFRRVARWENASYLVLLCVAMPLKYLAGFPLDDAPLYPSTRARTTQPSPHLHHQRSAGTPARRRAPRGAGAQ